ncbi:MAG: hypothetical protein SF029_16545 [bacterium]|nr:hypothetical protein [bacterium]
MDPDLWSVLHDGSILDIQGQVPGDLVVKFQILYLREMWPNVSGEHIYLHLKNCTLFEWKVYDSQGVRSYNFSELPSDFENSDDLDLVRRQDENDGLRWYGRSALRPYR